MFSCNRVPNGDAGSNYSGNSTRFLDSNVGFEGCLSSYPNAQFSKAVAPVLPERSSLRIPGTPLRPFCGSADVYVDRKVNSRISAAKRDSHFLCIWSTDLLQRQLSSSESGMSIQSASWSRGWASSYTRRSLSLRVKDYLSSREYQDSYETESSRGEAMMMMNMVDILPFC